MFLLPKIAADTREIREAKLLSPRANSTTYHAAANAAGLSSYSPSSTSSLKYSRASFFATEIVRRFQQGQ